MPTVLSLRAHLMSLRFVDDDLRYQQFLCPAPARGSTWSDYRATCTWS